MQLAPGLMYSGQGHRCLKCQLLHCSVTLVNLHYRLSEGFKFCLSSRDVHFQKFTGKLGNCEQAGFRDNVVKKINYHYV